MFPIIRTQDLKVIYNLGKTNEMRALDGVNIEIYPEEYVILLGPSGCGKSTLLYAILGLQKATYGEAYIKGKPISSFTEHDLDEQHRSSVGIVFQAYYLISTLSVIDNIILPQVFQGKGIKQRKERAMQLLTRFGIEGQAKKAPTSLSGGQQQRVAISRALINDPMIIFADEPVGNLDSKSATTAMEYLEKINEEDKKTILLVTHDPRYIRYAHRVYYMKDGKIVRESRNPAKAQIKPLDEREEVFTEIDQLGRLHPYTDIAKLKPLALVDYLTQDFNVIQRQRLEKSVSDLMERRINAETFYNVLDKPIEKGGVGLYKQTAQALTEKTLKVLNEVRVYKKGLSQPAQAETKRETIKQLRIFLVDDFQGELSYRQVERLDEAISKRMDGVFERASFLKYLDQSFNKGGVGLNRATAKRFTKRLEIILAESE